MNRAEGKYIIMLIVITLVGVIYSMYQPKPIDWSEGYSNSEKKPFGAYILFDLLDDAFPESEIAVTNESIFEGIPEYDIQNSIFISPSFSIDDFETDILIDYLSYGDVLFIASREISGPLADTLGIRMMPSAPQINTSANSLDSLISSGVNFTNEHIRKEDDWLFPSTLTGAYFLEFDTTRTEILGYSDTEKKEVNFIRIKTDSSYVYLHSNPMLFGNYYLRDPDYYQYAFSALSYLPDYPVVWDEYYKPGRISISSPMQYVVSKPNLKYAWMLTLCGIILYLVINSKRVQKVIPEIKPIRNTSIKFTETIANMYLNNGTQKDILEKKVTFLFDYIRTNLHIQIADADNADHETIAARSGIPESEIQSLFTAIRTMLAKTEISNSELVQINQKIDNFYKQSQR